MDSSVIELKRGYVYILDTDIYLCKNKEFLSISFLQDCIKITPNEIIHITTILKKKTLEGSSQK